MTYSGTGAGGREPRQSNSCSSFPCYQAIASLHHLPDEAGVVVGGVEIAAAPQDEGLVDGVLQAVVGVLGDAVFMALAGIDAGGAEAVVVQQGGVIVVKSAAAAAAQFVGGSPVLSLRTTSGTPPGTFAEAVSAVGGNLRRRSPACVIVAACSERFADPPESDRFEVAHRGLSGCK